MPLVLVALPCAQAQPYVPTPYARCLTVSRQMIEPGYPGYPSSAAEFESLLKQALENCPAGATEQPKNAAPRESLALALAFSGDVSGAAREARTAADMGSRDAQVLLGALHARGQGVKRDSAAALDVLRKVARQQSALASYNLAVLYANGEGVTQDYGEAFRHYNLAAHGNDVAGMLRAAQSYADGRGIGRDRAQAESWWRKAADALAVEARDHPARLREREALDPAQALEWFRARAGAGEPWAQTFLGLLYERGHWVRQDFPTALDWYRKAADTEFGKAEGRIAEMYSYGRGMPVDRDEAGKWGARWQERQCEAESRAGPATSECDRLAGDPYDPQKAGAGTKTFCMPMFAERAVLACRQALKSSPRTVRFRAQLARALLHAGNLADGRREAEAAARGGSTAAMVLLGALNEHGYGGAKAPAAALDWYRKAADRDDERAMKHAERLYAKDSPEAREMQERIMRISQRRAETAIAPQLTLAKEAEAGNAAAQHNLAASYEAGGVGGQKNYVEALKWYRLAAAQGYAPSQYNLAQMYEKGMGVPADTGQAISLYRKLAETGGGEARLRLGALEAQVGNYAEAHKWLNKSADEGNVRAMLELGILHEQGQGVPKDSKQAIKWYERAAPHSKWAEFKLGVIHFEERNYAAALKWWRVCADRGDPRALNNLAVMQERGLGMPRDEVAATEMYFKAAQAGSPHARATLEVMFEEGRGAPRDIAARIAWYRRGAELGLPVARFKLGQLYEQPGPTQDFAEAMKWYGLVEADPRAWRAMARLYRQDLGVPKEDAGPGNAVKRTVIVQMLLAQAEKTPARIVSPGGPALDPGADPQRTMQIRIAGTATAHSAAMDMGWYDVLRPPRRPAK